MFKKRKQRGRKLRRLFSFGARSRRTALEALESRWVLSTTVGSNDCPPDLDFDTLNANLPAVVGQVIPGEEVSFLLFDNGATLSDNESDNADIRLVLDPDDTPGGALLVQENDDFRFTWTPAADAEGTFSFVVIAIDNGSPPLADAESFSFTVDSRPVVDLNGENESGLDAGPFQFVEDGGPVDVAPEATVSFTNTDEVASVTATIMNILDAGQESLSVDETEASNRGIMVETPAEGQIRLSAEGGETPSVEDFEAVLQTLQYNNSSQDPDTTDRMIKVSANDGEQDGAVSTSIVEVAKAQDDPDLAEIDNQTAFVGEELRVQLTVDDPDADDTIIYQIDEDMPAGATIEVDPNDNRMAEFVWTPPLGTTPGPINVTIIVNDGSGETSPDSQSFTIQVSNSPPVAVDDPSAGTIEVSEDGPPIDIDVRDNDSDPNNDTFSVVEIDGTQVNPQDSVSLQSGAIVTLNDDGTVEYDPNGSFDNLAAGESTTDTFTYVIADDSEGDESDPATVTVTINGQNDPPTAVDDEGGLYVTDEETPLELNPSDGVLDNDTDPDTSDTLIVVEVNGESANVGSQITLASGALLTLNADGSFSYDPNGQFEDLSPGQSDTDTFTYAISDGTDTSSPATVTIQIDGVSEPPIAVEDNFDIDEDGPPEVLGVLDNDSDPDPGDIITITGIAGQPVIGNDTITLPSGARVTLLPGALRYDPNGAFESLGVGETDMDTFQYTISDGDTSATATVNVTINGENDSPVIDEPAFAELLMNALGLGGTPDLSEPIEIPIDTAVMFDFTSVVSDSETASGDLLYVLNFGTLDPGTNEPTLNSGGTAGLFAWTPNQAGDFEMTLTAGDTGGLSDNVTITFSVVQFV